MLRPDAPHRVLRAGALLWLLIVVFLVLLAGQRLASGPVFDTSLMALLPEEQRDPLVQRATDRITEGASHKLMLLVSAEADSRVREAVPILASHLREQASVAAVIWEVDAAHQQQRDAFYGVYRFALLDPQIRDDLEAGNTVALRQRALSGWFGPMGLGSMGGDLIADPFSLSQVGKLKGAEGISVTSDRGLLRVPGLNRPGYLLVVELAGDPFDLSVQRSLRQTLDQVQALPAFDGVKLQSAGLLLHAEAGARQASEEMSTVGLGSLLGIVLLMLWIFRSIRPLLLVLVSVGVGCLVAGAVTLLVFDRVHLITLVFGAGLVGVSIDYGLHLLCDWRERGNPWRSVRAIVPGLSLGLLSSVLAYSAQSLAPFPGLRQMALFSSAGLIGSWLTVVLWLPMLVGSKGGAMPAAATLRRLLSKVPHVRSHRSAQLTLVAAVLFSGWGLLNLHADDDIRLLQTSPSELLQQEQEMQRLLGHRSSPVFLLLEADNTEALLQQEEQLREQLDKLVRSGTLLGYQAVSEQLPSLRRQQQDLMHIRRLYEQELPALFQALGLGSQAAERVMKALESRESGYLEPQTWLAASVSKPYRNLLIPHHQGRVASVIRLKGISDGSRRQLEQVAADERDVRLVDRVENLSQLLGYYRHQVITWVGCAYLLLMMVLFLRYRWELWRIVVPPALASSVTLSLVSLLEGGLNLFHLLALLLVLGIGLDMGIFLRESGQRAYTWLAVFLSATTSILGFGLLTLSHTPVLHHFGLTVLIGLTLIWVLTPLLRLPEQVVPQDAAHERDRSRHGLDPLPNTVKEA